MVKILSRRGIRQSRRGRVVRRQLGAARYTPFARIGYSPTPDWQVSLSSCTRG
jgi:hypothetical protein